jgi:hypothetical protein
MEAEQIVEEFQESFSQEKADFNEFWFEGKRFQYRPFVGYVHAPFTSKTLNINQQGFRGEDFVYKKQPESKVKKVAFFGSSALVGIPNARDSETIPEFSKRVCKESGVEIEAYNFGLIAGTIKHELNLILQVLAEYDIDALILFSGYNDVHRSYHGQIWNAYKDIDDIFTAAFELNEKKYDLTFHTKNTYSAMRESIKRYRAQKKYGSKAKALKAMARKQCIQNEVMKTYEINRRIYLLYLQQIISAARYKGIPFLFCHQPSLYTSSKELTEYEKASGDFFSSRDFGLYRNSKKEHDLKMFKENFIIQKNETTDLAKNQGIISIDPDKLFSAKKKTLFYDYCHLLKEGNIIIGKEIATKMLEVWRK